MSHHTRVLWQGSQLVLGRFRAEPTDCDFSRAGPIGGRPEIAFPRTPVVIHQDGSVPFVADPTLAVLYNPHQAYRRAELVETGDDCEWLSVDPLLLYEANPRLGERSERPFRRTHTHVAAPAFMLVRLVAHRVSHGAPPDPLWIEESLIRVVGQCVDGRAWERPSDGDGDGTARKREWAFEVKGLLATELERKLTLAEIARRLGVSSYYLCRVFFAVSGYTLHAYRTELRLRTSLAFVLERGDDLTSIALDLGFSSHSHFTAAFRKRFGLTPSQFRARPSLPDPILTM